MTGRAVEERKKALVREKEEKMNCHLRALMCEEASCMYAVALGMYMEVVMRRSSAILAMTSTGK